MEVEKEVPWIGKQRVKSAERCVIMYSIYWPRRFILLKLFLGPDYGPIAPAPGPGNGAFTG